MSLAYAATGAAGPEAHEGAHSVGDAILHHVQDTNVFEIWPPHVKIPLPEIHLFGIDFSITKHLILMWIAAIFLSLLFWRLTRQ